MRHSQDVWFCAFLLHKGYKIASYEVLPGKKVKCAFTIEDDEWQKLKLEFQNGDIVKFKSYIEQLKDLAW